MVSKVILIVLSLFLFSCQNVIDIDAEKKKIQSQIDLVDQAHYKKDAALFYQPNAEQWYDVRNGNVQQVHKSNAIPSTQSYLDEMDFHEMIRHRDPIIEISEDGTLASYIGAVTVKGILNETPIYWVVSWQSVLRKINGEWKIISTANTEANKQSSAAILMDQIRKKMGVQGEADISSIYAYADCQGPERAFQTLLLSNQNNGRMEQVYENGHIILKHGKDSSWTYNLKTESLKEDIDPPTKTFIHGHELHWLSFWPEQRYSSPVFKGVSQFGGKTVFHIEFKDIANKPVNFYYSFDTYKPLGFVLQTDQKEGPVTVHFESWEKIDNIDVFKKATFTQGDEIFEYDFVDIKLNQLKDTDFETKEGLIK